MAVGLQCFMTRLVAMVCSASLLMPTLSASAQDQQTRLSGQRFFLQMETAGQGPSQHVIRFIVDPRARTAEGRAEAEGSSTLLPILAEAYDPDDPAWLEGTALQAALEDFEITIGLMDGAADLLGGLAALESVKSVMLWLGATLTVVKVAYELQGGETEAAAASAYLGSWSLMVSRYGWSALQMTSLAALWIDWNLRNFADEAWLQRTDAWRRAYTAYYRNRGRNVNDWRVLVHTMLQRSGSDAAFQTTLNAELDRYVAQAWSDSYLDEVVADSGAGIAGITRYAELSGRIRRALEDEHRAELHAEMLTHVLPEVTFRAWLDSLDSIARDATLRVRPQLNMIWELTVTAHDIDASTRFTIPLPAGGVWSGTLEPGIPRTLRMTTLAALRAGGPHEIVLEHPQGPLTQPIAWHERRATVSFGMPQASYVSAFDRSETEARCEVTHRLPDGTVDTAVETRPAPAPDVIHIATTAAMGTILGRFNPQTGWQTGWQTASPGRMDQGQITFAPPWFEDIVAFTSCEGGLMQGDLIASARCTVVRETVSFSPFVPPQTDPSAAASLPAGQIETRRVCTSAAVLAIKGIHLPEEEGWQYYSLEGEAGRIIRDALRQGMQQGFSFQ